MNDSLQPFLITSLLIVERLFNAIHCGGVCIVLKNTLTNFSYLWMVMRAVSGFSPVDVVLELLAVVGAIGAVLDLGGLDVDLGGKARTQLVSNDQDQVGVRNKLDTERPGKNNV